MGTTRPGFILLSAWLFMASASGFGAKPPTFLGACFRGLYDVGYSILARKPTKRARDFPAVTDIQAAIDLHRAAHLAPYEPVSERHAFRLGIVRAAAAGTLSANEIPALMQRLRGEGIPIEVFDELRALADAKADGNLIFARVRTEYPTFADKLTYLAYQHGHLDLPPPLSHKIRSWALASVHESYLARNLEQSVAASGLSAGQWEKMQREAKAVLSADEFIERFATARPRSKRDLVALGVNKTPYDFGTSYAGASSFFEAHVRFVISLKSAAQTSLFMHRLMKSDAEILFFMPEDLTKTTHTRAELEILLKLSPSEMKRVTFVFGMYTKH